MITKSDIPDYAPTEIDLPNGWSAKIRTERDEDMGAPWEEHDGHGPVSDWRPRPRFSDYDGKRAGERVLVADRSSARYYDFAKAVQIAKRGGWGCSHIHEMEDFATFGGHKSKNELAACAAERDFERMRAWCSGEWEWIGVIVAVLDADGQEVESGSLWGIESDSDYWREVAAELINEIAGGLVLPNFDDTNSAAMEVKALTAYGQDEEEEVRAEADCVICGHPADVHQNPRADVWVCCDCEPNSDRELHEYAYSPNAPKGGR